MGIQKLHFVRVLLLGTGIIQLLFSGPIPGATSGERHTEYGVIADRIITAALTETKGYELLRDLCTLGPRLSGSENSMKAIYWARDKMRELAFDRVWLQPVMVPHWVRGETEDARILTGKYSGKKLSIGALGGSVPTRPGGITAQVLEVGSFDELHERTSEARGRIIFFNYPMKPEIVNTFAAYGDAVRYRSDGATEAAKAGGVAAIIRSVTTRRDDNPHLGMMRYGEDAAHIPTAAVSIIGAELLSLALRADPELELRLALSCHTLPDAQSYTVIGELKGYEKPDEIIVVGGHFDSWDAGDGAHDCGGGCMQAVEVLDIFRQLGIKPKRTIRCVLFMNEENGLRGAKEYARYAAEATREKHIAAIESDRGLFTPRGFYIDADLAIVQKMQSWLPFLRRAGIEWVRHGGGGPDVNYIKNALARIDYVPDGQRYFDAHHSANDVFESVNPREMELGSAALAILAYLISEEGL